MKNDSIAKRPGRLHRVLKSRAALEGRSLSDYLLAEIRHVAERPTLKEIQEQLRRRSPTDPTVPPADAVREVRDRH